MASTPKLCTCYFMLSSWPAHEVGVIPIFTDGEVEAQRDWVLSYGLRASQRRTELVSVWLQVPALNHHTLESPGRGGDGLQPSTKGWSLFPDRHV